MLDPTVEAEERTREADEGFGELDQVGIRRERQSAEPEETSPEAVPRRSWLADVPPWLMSMALACSGALASVLVWLFPNLRRFPLPFQILVFTPYLVLVVPMAAAIWALTGMLPSGRRAEWRWCAVALGIALLSILCTLALFWMDPSRW